jgi:hypothetical protein
MHHQAIIGFLELGRMMLLLLPMGLGLAWSLAKITMRQKSNPRLTIWVGLFVVQAFLSSRVDPVMNFLFRYLVAYLPILIAIALDSVAAISSRAISLTAMAAVVVSLFLPWPRTADYVQKTREIKVAQWAVIDWLRPKSDSTTVSMTDMGLIPYYTEKRFFDTFGLVNEDIAHVGFIPKTEFMRQPDYFIMVGFKAGTAIKVLFWREQRIAYHEISIREI